MKIYFLALIQVLLPQMAESSRKWVCPLLFCSFRCSSRIMCKNRLWSCCQAEQETACSPSCENGGTCVKKETDKTFFCVCPKDYSGSSCEVKECPDHCGHYDDYHDFCDEVVGGFECRCKPGYEGQSKAVNGTGCFPLGCTPDKFPDEIAQGKYCINSENKIWDDHRTVAQGLGGDLAAIADYETQQFIRDMDVDPDLVWLGSKHDGAGGTWSWVLLGTEFWEGNNSTGSELCSTPDLWFYGYPTYYFEDSGDCLVTGTHHGLWGNFNCSLSFRGLYWLPGTTNVTGKGYYCENAPSIENH